MCHICRQRSDADGLTRKKWFACCYCLLSNEEGIRPFYGQGTGKGRGRGKDYDSDEDLDDTEDPIEANVEGADTVDPDEFKCWKRWSSEKKPRGWNTAVRRASIVHVSYIRFLLELH